MTRLPLPALILLTLLAGLVVRFAPLPLPRLVSKYGGSVLWALMIFWIVHALLRSPRPPITAVVTACVTAAVECFKLVHTPALDRFRHTLAGVLLLGRVFSVWDLVAYAAAIILGLFLLTGLAAGRPAASV